MTWRKRSLVSLLAAILVFGLSGASTAAVTPSNADVDGTYALGCMGKYLHVNSGKVELRDTVPAQTFDVINKGDYVYIKDNDGKYLSLSSSAKPKDGEQLYTRSTSYAWVMKKHSENVYSIYPYGKTSVVVNANGERNANGTEMIVWPGDGSKKNSQITLSTGTEVLEDGEYTLGCLGKYLYVNSDRKVELRDTRPIQTFTVINKDEYVYIEDKYGMYLSLGSTRDPKDGEQLMTSRNAYAWVLKRYNGSVFSIYPYRKSTMVVNADGESSKNGTKMIVWPGDGAKQNSQITFSSEENLPEDGEYTLGCMGKYLYVNDQKLEIRDIKPAQRFTLTNKGKYFYIEDEDGRYLRLGSTDNPGDGEQLVTGKSAYAWTITHQSGNQYTIHPYGKGSLVVNANKEQSANGTKMIVWPGAGIKHNSQITFSIQ